MGLGWIALVHDKNNPLAEKIFAFVSTKTKSPEPLYKMVHAAEAKEDTNMQKKYAAAFETKVTDPLYGNMYNKYLIDLFTGILNKPALAEALAEKELQNRATAQTYTWYAYSLLKNNKPDEAFKIYQQHISGKPLEALELYWVGKLMQGLNKNYNAIGFFKAAYKNRFDLSPAKAKDLESIPGVK
jgi:tetratricopeptide (TPR) repeat protein